MLEFVKDNLVKILRETADKIDAGNSEVDEEQAVKIMELIAHKTLTKEEAAYLIGYIIQQMHRVFKYMIGTGIE